MGIFRAIVPKRPVDAVVVSVLAAVLFTVGYKLVLQTPPEVRMYSETEYPKEVVRGSYFYLNFDLSFDKACSVIAKRYIIGSDGVEYLASEDRKEVAKDERMQYVVRVPVVTAIPLGQARMRSDFEYGCDWWSRNVRPVTTKGRTRNFLIVSQVGDLIRKDAACELPPEPGMTVVRAHYRRLTTKLALKD